MIHRRLHWLIAWALVVAASLGCESVQRKFERKGKMRPRASPIFSFEDYSRSSTPLDRYRKHHALFDYWNAELLDALSAWSPNPKRLTKSSMESLSELQQLHTLLQDGVVPQLTAAIERRARLDEELRGGAYPPSRLVIIRRDVEAQTRELRRQLHWRKVEDQIKADAPAPNAVEAPAPESSAPAEPAPGGAPAPPVESQDAGGQ